MVVLFGLSGAIQAQRAPAPAFKGMELYSWSEGGSWRYALLHGTNRNKSWPELAAARIDESQLRGKLSTLAVQEQVSWCNQCPTAPRPLGLPPKETREGLQKLCEDLQIKLYIAIPKTTDQR